MAHTPGASEVEVRTRDGWILRGERLADPSAPAVVVLGHAMFVDRRTLDRPPGRGLASALHARGLDVLWLDVRGHGESGPGARQGGRWTYEEIVRHDVPALVGAGREAARGRPVFLLGHSLVGHAGLIAAGLAPETAPDGLVAYAPNLWAPDLEPSRALRLLKRGTMWAWSAVTSLRGRFDPAPFRLGRAAEAPGYVRELASLMRDGLGAYERAIGRAALDVLAVSSARDRLLARPASVERFLALAGRAKVTSLLLEGPDAPDHMGFVTDRRSEGLWAATARWILERSA